MKKNIQIFTPEDFGIIEKNGKIVCDSINIAKVFHKQHQHVLRDIDKILNDFSKVSQSKFGLSNFIFEPYEKRGKAYPRYYLTRDGFTKLVFGYNGEEAIKYQIAYIEQFNSMERRLMRAQAERSTLEWQEAREQLKPIRRELTDVIQEKEPDNIWAYKHYTDLAYKAATGKIARKLREERGAGKTANAIDCLTADELQDIAKKESQIAVLREMDMDYEQIKALLFQKPLPQIDKTLDERSVI